MGGRGKGGGGGHTPIEQPNTLESAQKLKIIDLLCEGVAGQDVTFKNIYLDNTPVQNEDGSYNFTGIRVSALPGTHNQDYLAGFDSTDKIVSVGAEVKASKPITRTITDPLVDSVRITLALGSLVTLKDNGDRVGGSVSLTVNCGNKNYPVTITGKTTSAYHQDVVLTDLPDTPFNISVHRNTPDSTTDSVSNVTHWVSYVESIDAKFNYPNAVVVGLEIDSAQFGGKIPTRTYLNKWTQIKVPNNYDPITRSYDGIWLGEFKTAWSNNPAWVFYDLVTDKRYGLGDRLGDFGCDKWSLYQIAKYCDQIVPDGFGGEEPRFTCNAYISEPNDAKALLDDLASVFRGIAVWDGQQVMALQDAKKDPVSTYTNANVADGLFGYQGAGQKTIFTAAHVKYNDKTDGYATKTEYVANDDAIKRYGLNVKQITAFGCTSRGQAARVGKWLIETSISEQQLVTFKVGREGIRHLPFDIIEIADNDYAGDMIAGRVRSVQGNTITTDRKMSDIRSIRYYANGQSKTMAVQSVAGTKITLADIPVGIEQLGVFNATKTDVKPRLFRALSIKEDGDTYTISAVQHDANKEAVVDQGVTFEQDKTATKHKPQVSYGRVSKDGDELLIAWEGTNTTEYLIKIYKDGELYRSYTQDSAEIKLKGLPNGEYKAEIRGKSANGQLTEAVIKEWSIDYDIKGLKATPELFAIKLDWTNPTTVINKAKVEVYRSLQNNRATATKVATLSYPTDTFAQNGVKLSETHYFWLRLIDDQGNTGNWVTVSGQCSDDTSQIVASINGKITQTELSQSLINSLQSDIDAAKSTAITTANSNTTKLFNQAQSDIADARSQLATAVNNINTERTRINGAIRDVGILQQQSDTQKQQVNTLTAKQSELSSSIEQINTTIVKDNQSLTQQINTIKAQAQKTDSEIKSINQSLADNEQAISTTHDQLSAKFDNLEIGGRNLVLNSDQLIEMNSRGNHPNGYQWTNFYLTQPILAQGEYTVSLDVKSTVATDVFYISLATGHISQIFFTRDASVGKDWTRLSFTVKNTVNDISNIIITNHYIYGTAEQRSNNGVLSVRNIKLERGTKATDWTPAPEDVQADIAQVATQSNANIDSLRQVVTNVDSALSTRIDTLDASFNSNKASVSQQIKTLTDKDSATSQKISSLDSSVKGAQSKIIALEKATSDNTQAISTTHDQLSAKFDNLEVGGRNLILNSKELNIAFTTGAYAKIPSSIANSIDWVGKTVTLSFEAKSKNGTEKIYISLANNVNTRQFLTPRPENLQPTTEWQTYVFTVEVTTKNTVNSVLYAVGPGFAGGAANGLISLRNIKLERGNKATDWTPAPEDVTEEINNTKASLDEFKQTQAGKDSAQTIATNQALSRIGDAESKITTLQNTTVTKDKAQSTHTIKTQAIAGGKRALAGIAVGAMASEQTAESQVIVMADNFGVVRDAGDGVVKPMFSLVNNQAVFNGDLIADGTILGKHIKANQKISAPIINGGELNINDRFIVDKYGNLTGKSGTFEGDVRLKNGQVDTLQIANEAVIVPRLQFTAGAETERVAGAEKEINRITLNAQGGAVAISFGFERLVAFDFGNPVTVVVSIRRNNEVIREFRFGTSGGQVDHRWITVPTYLDKPPSGDNTYTVTMRVDGRNENYIGTTITARSFQIMGVKR